MLLRMTAQTWVLFPGAAAVTRVNMSLPIFFEHSIGWTTKSNRRSFVGRCGDLLRMTARESELGSIQLLRCAAADFPRRLSLRRESPNSSCHPEAKPKDLRLFFNFIPYRVR
jgi:hypothetical protein